MIESQRGAVRYRQDPEAPWQVQIQFGKGRAWELHSVCSNAREAARKVLRLGQGLVSPQRKKERTT